MESNLAEQHPVDFPTTESPAQTHVVFGVAACVLGLWVISGWFLRLPLWVRLLPGFAPMQFNTAAGIVLAGLGVALLQRLPRLAAACGVLVAILGAAVLVQFSIGIDLGIDELLFETWLESDASTPGRMGINTAVCFLIVGLCLASSMGQSSSWAVRRTLVGMCLLSISIVLLFGYLSGLESALRWGETTRMAAHTAFSFALLGAGLVGSWRPLTSHGQRLGKSMAVGICLAAVAVFVWSGVMAEQRDLIQERLNRAALNAASMLANDVRAVASALKRLDERRSFGCREDADACAGDLLAYFRDYPELNRLGWIGAQGAVFYHRPPESRSLGEPETGLRYEARLLEARLDEVSPGESVSVVLQPESGPAVFVILNKKAAAAPTFFASFDASRFSRRRAPSFEQGWSQSVWLGSLSIDGLGSRETGPGQLAAERKMTVLGTALAFVVGAELADLHPSSFNDLTLLFGLLMAFSVGSATFLLQTSLDRSNALRVNNQKLAEETRRAAEASRSKSEFLAVMSHEIRTPMNAILGMAELLRESKLTDEQRRYIDICHRAGSNLLVLINDILDLSKIEAGRLNLDQASFRLSDLVSSTSDLVSGRARARGLALEVNILPGTQEHLIGDATRLRQVLVNLLGNAVKFTDSGKVILTVGPSKSGLPGEIHFAVADTGRGIPADKLDMIFDRFTQVDSSATREHGGTGLGLAISRRLVGLMGGQLAVTSTVGEGSTFGFSVPFLVDAPIQTARQPAKVEAPSSPGSVAATPPLRILVADDSFDNQLLIREYLKDSPHELSFVDDGQSAIHQFLAEEFDLILMDIQMPGLDGLAATRAIREIEKEVELPPLPILALTASARLIDVRESEQAGCTAYLAKPISKARLLEAVAESATAGSSHLAGTSPANRRASSETRERLKKMASAYLVRQRQELSRMLQYLSDSDFESLRRLGHNLKGTGAAFGFRELTELGEAIEVSAAKADADAIRNHLADMENCLERADLTRTG